MDFRNLFITRYGLSMDRVRNCIILKGRNTSIKIPFDDFSNLFVLSEVSIPPEVLEYLSRRGKFVFILSSSGSVDSIILPEPLPVDVKVKEKQCRKFSSEELRVFIARELTWRKGLIAQKFLLKFREAQGEPGHFSVYKSFFRDISRFIDEARNMEQLKRMDNFVMRNLMNQFKDSIKKFYAFKTRSFSPVDESITVLNLNLAMFYSILFPLIVFHGLDPRYGFFHTDKGKHENLAADLLELAKPKLMFFSADLLNRGFFNSSDFKRLKTGVSLKPKAMNVLCKLFMERLFFSDLLFPVQSFIKEVILR